ncbi:MAG: NUDIX domain-containing protein [Anaerolineae bacterium]|jgi:8-oxo-dGTP diphosphatase
MAGSQQEPATLCECPQISVDVVIFSLRDAQLRILLVSRQRPPFENTWAIPGGVVRDDEALERAAQRQLEEQTGLVDVFLEQLYTFGDPHRHPHQRIVSVTYFAVVPPTGIVPRAADDGQRVRWWPMGDLPPLAFDHGSILDYALTRLRYKLEYTAVGFELLPQTFTLTELQTAYEIVLGETLDKRNFRRKILSAEIIEPTGEYRAGEGRPAQLYRYRQDAVAEVKARRLFP